MAEDLADIIMDRARRRLPEIIHNENQQPMAYIRTVANNEINDYFNERKRHALISIDDETWRNLKAPDATEIRKKEALHQQLDQCLAELPGKGGEFLRRYYKLSGRQASIEREKMAAEMRLTINALRLKIMRHIKTLEKCIKRHQKTPHR